MDNKKVIEAKINNLIYKARESVGIEVIIKLAGYNEEYQKLIEQFNKAHNIPAPQNLDLWRLNNKLEEEIDFIVNNYQFDDLTSKERQIKYTQARRTLNNIIKLVEKASA